MIHTFTALGQYLVADVNSGAVHVLDRMSYDLLSLLEKEETMGETCPREIRERLTQYSVLHNLHFYNELMARIRQALDEGNFESFRRTYSGLLDRPAQE